MKRFLSSRPKRRDLTGSEFVLRTREQDQHVRARHRSQPQAIQSRAVGEVRSLRFGRDDSPFLQGVAINPGTAQIDASRLLGQLPVYDMHAFPKSGVFVHVPGAIRDAAENGEALSFTADGRPREPYYVLLAGLHGAKSIQVGGVEVVNTPSCVVTATGCTILCVKGKCRVEIAMGP